MISGLFVKFGRFILRRWFNLTIDVAAGVKMWTFICPKCGFKRTGSNRFKIWNVSSQHDCEWKKR